MTPGKACGRCARLWFSLALVTLAAAAHSQTNGNGEHAEVTPFAVTDWSGALGYEFAWRREKQTSDRGSDYDRELHRHEEYIQFNGQGYVYHPRFMSYDAMFRLGLLQQRYSSDPGDSASANELLDEFDVSALFFPEKLVSFRARAARRDDVVRDLFSDILLFEETTVGGDILFNSPIAPSRTSYTHRDYSQTGFSSETDSTLDTVEHSTRLLPGTDFTTDIHYLFRDYEERFRSDAPGLSFERTTDLTSHDLGATNVWRFGRRSRNRLTTSGRFYDQTGTVETRQYRASQRLDLEHSPRLDSFISGAYDRVETTSQTSDTTRLRAGVHHRLYESLDSFAEGRYRNTSFDIGDDEEVVGGGLRFAYRKRTPRGLLSAGYSVDVDAIDRGSAGITRTVLDESIVLTDGTLTFLSEQSVIAGSVNVTNSTGLTTYTEDLDYRLIEVGSRTQIERIFGGAIANGDLVLVDYQFVQTEDSDFTQISQGLNVRHDWTEGFLENLALYYRLNDLRNSGSTGGVELLEFTDHLFGSNYRWRWFNWTEEYEIFDANISPHNTFRSALSAQANPWRQSRVRAGVEYLMIEYTDSGEEDTDLLTFSGDLRTPITDHWDWQLETLYRMESGRNKEDSFGVASKLVWAFRKVTAELGIRYEMLDRSGTDRDDVQLFFSLTRAF
jgi:hypothetical protein